jgi:NADH dehydrogenase/NADH:ubiquinone oxidoreductase subunit G
MNFFITVNNKEIEAVKGETVLQALRRAGISVPTLCNMEGFTPTGACRLCMVEVTGKSDLVPACSFPVEEWMEVQTHTPKVIKARRVIVELLLSGHPDDCLYCERNCHCELQDLAFELNIRERRHSGKKINKVKDLSSPAIIRDPAKCILCGRCVRICEEVMGCSTFEFSGKGNISGITTTYGQPLNNSSCITCGQCVMGCPTGALYEKKNLAELQLALTDPGRYPVAILDPVVSLTISEMNGNKNYRQGARQLIAILKKCGFREVLDFASLQDLYIKKVAEEVIAQGKLVLSSNCPAWIKYAEQYMPELIPEISRVKSPSQLGGTIFKQLYQQKSKGDTPPAPYVASLTPCTARKFEARRKEFTDLAANEVDAAITTRALEQLIKLNGLDLGQVEAEDFARPFHTASLHGELAGIAGGTMEAVASTVFHMLSGGKDLVDQKQKKTRTGKSFREIEFTINRKSYRFAAVSGMAEASRFLADGMKKGNGYNFVEVMACPGGCVNGGGQPISREGQNYRQRQKQAVELADRNALSASYRNRTTDDLLLELQKEGKLLDAIILTNYYPRKVK